MTRFGNLGHYTKKLHFDYLLFGTKLKKSLIVSTHGIIKKTNKTPLKEIERAKQLKKEYLKNKKNENI